MSTISNVDALNAERREQPFLYSWNRRLRHLHGISLRNLNISSTFPRSRRKTITEDDSNLKTRVRKLVQNEARTLHHARSYDQLLKPLHDDDRPRSPADTGDGSSDLRPSPKRPARANLRRRSTLHWSTSSPRARQSKLEAVEVNRLVDTWFSLHHDGIEQPIYISEVLEDSMNPTFSFFDLVSLATEVLRSSSFVLRVWSKSEVMDEYLPLVEMSVDMRSLQFIGRSLDTFHHPLPENCVLFHLSDGIYTSFTDLPAESTQQPSPTPAMRAMAATQNATFDALLKLANLDDVIQDALRTRATIEADIDKLIASMPGTERALSELSSQRDQTRNAVKAREVEQRNIEAARKAVEEKRELLRSKRDLLKTKGEHESLVQQSCKTSTDSLQKTQKILDGVEETSMAQIRRISYSLLQIFPIEPVKNKTLQFTIRNVHLPNSTFSDTNSDDIAAALGFTAQLVHQLSLYVSVPLPYAIQPNGSGSFIHDDISAGIAQRQFPLHPTGAAYKFEYGVFLLNKDIEFLMNRSGLRAMDIRQTLPNLKYLMFVLTAGNGDLPGRKVGGVRGLFRGGVSPSISRRNSEESVISNAFHEKSDATEDIFSGPVRARGLPYRKSMLRDAG